MKIFQSATKLVLVLMTVAVIALTFIGKFDPKDFGALVVMVFMSYFKSPNPSNNG